MPSRFTWGLVALACVAALSVAVPLALATATQSGEPGNAANGKKVFVAFCGKCHTLAAAGAKGTLGPNLDSDKVNYTRIVTAIEEGVGGIQAEYVLRSVTFSEVFDVAKYIIAARKGGPGVMPFNAGSP